MSGTGAKPMTPGWRQSSGPVLVTAIALLVMAGLIIIRSGGDPLVLARLGTRYSQGDPSGTEGYDGQFVYYIATDPDPERVASKLDVPAYRYQRILLPLLARLLSLGNAEALPWVLLGIGVLSQALGTWVVARLLLHYNTRPWIGLSYGLWAGFTMAVLVDLPEPLAFALIAAAILASEFKKENLAVVFFSLALFAKEVSILFMAAYFGYQLLNRDWRRAGVVLLGMVPFLLFQVWLWLTFGSPGIGSGGANATPFEWIPFLGLARIAGVDMTIFLVFLLVFGPSIVLPAVWGIRAAINKMRVGDLSFIPLALLVNAVLIPFVPFSTFREPGGLLRFACGLLLAVILFAARYKQTRVLNYSWFLLALNVFLIE